MSGAHIIMPAEAGIHDFAARINGKSWMPTFVGMTGNGERRVDLSAGWYNAPPVFVISSPYQTGPETCSPTNAASFTPLSAAIISAAFSPIMMDGALVLPLVMLG